MAKSSVQSQVPAQPPAFALFQIDLTSWRVSAGVRAQRITQDVAALAKPNNVHAQAATSCVQDAVTVITRSQQRSWVTRLFLSAGGADVERAWQLLKLAEEQVMLAKDDAELIADVPWLCSVARLSFPSASGDTMCATLNGWSGKKGKPSGRLAADILASQHAQSNADHQQTRSLRNLLYQLTLVVLVFDLIVWLLGLDLGAPTRTVLALGALGGALAMVFAVAKGSPVAPYNLALPQLLLKIVSGSAVAVAALSSSARRWSTDPLSRADVLMYALIFGFSQQLFTQLVDNRAAALKDAIAPAATKANSNC